MITKVCTKCNIKKDLLNFATRKQSKGGINTICRSCVNHRQTQGRIKVSINRKERGIYHKIIECPLLRNLNRQFSKWDYKIKNGNKNTHLNSLNRLLNIKINRNRGVRKSKEDFYINNPTYNRDYYLKNKEHIYQINLKWKERNKEKHKELQNKSFVKNKAKIRIASNARKRKGCIDISNNHIRDLLYAKHKLPLSLTKNFPEDQIHLYKALLKLKRSIVKYGKEQRRSS